MIDYKHPLRVSMKAQGWRFCHNKSARKHRRQGHEVRYFANGEYAWRNPQGGWIAARYTS